LAVTKTSWQVSTSEPLSVTTFAVFCGVEALAAFATGASLTGLTVIEAVAGAEVFTPSLTV
jgi:hypothetical protein